MENLDWIPPEPEAPVPTKNNTMLWILEGEWKFKNGYYTGIRKRMKYLSKKANKDKLFDYLVDNVEGKTMTEKIKWVNLQLWKWVKVVKEYEKWNRRDDLAALFLEEDLPPGYGR
jgi:hypothetical protein